MKVGTVLHPLIKVKIAVYCFITASQLSVTFYHFYANKKATYNY